MVIAVDSQPVGCLTNRGSATISHMLILEDTLLPAQPTATMLVVHHSAAPVAHFAAAIDTPSTITARRTRRYTSTLYIPGTIHRLDFESMNDGGRYIFQPPQC